jgi:hypothetical protein
VSLQVASSLWFLFYISYHSSKFRIQAVRVKRWDYLDNGFSHCWQSCDITLRPSDPRSHISAFCLPYCSQISLSPNCGLQLRKTSWRVNVFRKTSTRPWPADNDSLLTPSQTLKMADKLSVTKEHRLLFIMLHCWCIKIINGVRRPTLGSFVYCIPVRFNCVDLFIDGIVVWACATHRGAPLLAKPDISSISHVYSSRILKGICILLIDWSISSLWILRTKLLNYYVTSMEISSSL